jgi:hypothetical protein
MNKMLFSHSSHKLTALILLGIDRQANKKTAFNENCGGKRRAPKAKLQR